MFRPRGALLEPLHAGPAVLLMRATTESQSNPEMELGAFDHMGPCQKCRSSSISEVSYGTIRFSFYPFGSSSVEGVDGEGWRDHSEDVDKFGSF